MCESSRLGYKRAVSFTGVLVALAFFLFCQVTLSTERLEDSNDACIQQLLEPSAAEIYDWEGRLSEVRRLSQELRSGEGISDLLGGENIEETLLEIQPQLTILRTIRNQLTTPTDLVGQLDGETHLQREVESFLQSAAEKSLDATQSIILSYTFEGIIRDLVRKKNAEQLLELNSNADALETNETSNINESDQHHLQRLMDLLLDPQAAEESFSDIQATLKILNCGTCEEEASQDQIAQFLNGFLQSLDNSSPKIEEPSVNDGGESEDIPPLHQIQGELAAVFINDLWLSVLRSAFINSSTSFDRLGQFITFALQWLPEDSAKIWAGKAADMHSRLSAIGVRYPSLAELGQDLLSTDQLEIHRRVLTHFHIILEEIHSLQRLNPTESAFRDWLKQDRVVASSSSAIDDHRLAELFLESLVGPLSRDAVEKSLQQVLHPHAYGDLAEQIRAGKLDALLGISRVSPYLSLFTPKGLTFKDGEILSFQKDAADEDDPDSRHP